MTELSMAPIFPVTALAKDPKTVKREAEQHAVRITENGRGAFVFMGEEVFRKIIERERADAAYEAYLLDAVGEGAADVAAGRVTHSRSEMFARAQELRGQDA